MTRSFLKQVWLTLFMIIKERCEDFLVDEQPLEGAFSTEPTNYHVYLLKKTNYTTQRAITRIAQSLKIPLKNIGFAGTKDKNAITTQYITVRGANKERVEQLSLKDIELTFVGYAKDHLRLGDLEGNKFTLLVKDVNFIEIVPQEFFVPNYFDEQRFSTHNVELGKHILKKQYKEAVNILLSHDEDFKENIQQHLQKQENDYIGALRLIPRKILLFYIHAIQSYIFNERLAAHMRKSYDVNEVMYSEGIFTFPKNILKEVEQQQGELFSYQSKEAFEDIDPHDFINKSLPELAVEGGVRDYFSKVTDCTLTKKEDGVEISFSLKKGCYATIVLKQLFSK